MNHLQTSLAVILAAADDAAELENFPLSYQVTCLVLTALFLWSFSIARDPRSWRRMLYRTRSAQQEEPSLNRKKRLDERIRKYGIALAMAFLVVDVSFFVLGITYRYRHSRTQMTQEDKLRTQDMERIMGNAPQGSVRRAIGGN